MGKTFSPLIFFSSHCHLTKTDPSFPAVLRLTVSVKHRPDLIQRLVSQTIYPPKLRIRDPEGTGSVQRQPALENFSLGRNSRNLDLIVTFPFFLPLDLKIQKPVIFFLALPDIHIFQGSVFYIAQIYRAEDPRIGKMGAPVPAEHIVGFAQVHKSFVSILISDIFILFVGLGNELQRRAEDHLEHIILFQILFYLIVPGSVHVFCMSQIGSVKPDIRHSIQSFKGKEHPGICFWIFCRKSALILIICLHKRADLIFIILPVGIRDLSVSQKICIYRSPDSGFPPVFLSCPAHTPIIF